MKKIFVLIIFIGLTMGGCKNSESKKNEVQTKENSGEKYFYFDDEVEKKSEVKIDTAIFRSTMNGALPAQRILELFGGGYQNFYLTITIEPTGEFISKLSPEAGWLFSGLGGIERMLFKENLEIAKEFAMIPEKEGDPKVFNLRKLFYFPLYDFNKTFIASPGMKGGEKVRTLKIFQVNVIIDYAKNIVKPWTISELNPDIFRPHIISNLSQEYYAGYFPSVLREEFKIQSKFMGYPTEAKNKGVSGKVLIKIFSEADGEYAGYQLLKGLGYGCDEEVIDGIKLFKPKSFPSGQRSSAIVSFKFGVGDETPVDLTADPLVEQNPDRYNNLYLRVFNKLKSNKPIKSEYKLTIVVNHQVVSTSLLKVGTGEKAIYTHWKPEKGGTYDYEIYIDIENALNDIDRSNNIMKGKLAIK